jgi:hypothetical protein
MARKRSWRRIAPVHQPVSPRMRPSVLGGLGRGRQLETNQVLASMYAGSDGVAPAICQGQWAQHQYFRSSLSLLDNGAEALIRPSTDTDSAQKTSAIAILVLWGNLPKGILALRAHGMGAEVESNGDVSHGKKNRLR